MSQRVVVARGALLAPLERPKADVPLPEFGDGVVVPVWGMTAKEWTAFQFEQHGKDGKPNSKAKKVRERLIVACCRNDDGTPIFTPEDIEQLGNQSSGIVERIANAILKTSGITEADVEDLGKN